jgi:catechol 2,3-dioxygenase-like lactoylglutathione lyase family enzyme
MPLSVLAIDHFSFTVGEIERSAAFYQRFGFEPVKRYISAGPEVDEGADTERGDMDIQWLSHPAGGAGLELIRYLNYPADPAPHNSNVGAAHVCLSIDDVYGAHAELVADGIVFLSDPHEDEFGVRWVYCRDPDGNAVELVQNPGRPRRSPPEGEARNDG